LQTDDQIYERKWKPRDYLQQYYADSTPAKDERANAQFMAQEMTRLGRRFSIALEFGCGPTIHHAASLVPYVDELHMSDYLSENLEQIRAWLDDRPGAHDWSVYLSGVLDAEGLRGTVALATRERAIRRAVSALKIADIRRQRPLNDGSTYELVASYYCIEAVATTRHEWAAYLGNVARLVRPGGVMILGVMRRGRAYMVLDQTFPFAYIDEADLADELPRLGFPIEKTRIQVFDDVGWADEGFNSICCVCAAKVG